METSRSRYFEPAAWALALVIVAGFARSFFLREWFDVPPLASLLYVHGTLFTAWVVLFVVQVRLVAVRRQDLHRRLGAAGLVLALLMVVVGWQATTWSAALPKPHVMGLSSAQFSLIPLVELAGFIGFVAAALLLRRRAAWHKRLMLLAMITMIAPAVARLITLAGLGSHYLAVQVGVTMAFIGWGLAWDWRRNRQVHPAFAVWGTLLVVSWPLRMWVAHTAAWEPIGQWVARMGS